MKQKNSRTVLMAVLLTVAALTAYATCENRGASSSTQGEACHKFGQCVNPTAITNLGTCEYRVNLNGQAIFCDCIQGQEFCRDEQPLNQVTASVKVYTGTCNGGTFASACTANSSSGSSSGLYNVKTSDTCSGGGGE